jgi:hypothetical protein
VQVKRQREAEGAKVDSSKIADITESSGTKDTRSRELFTCVFVGTSNVKFLTFGQVLMVVRPMLDVPPMNIGCDGVIVPGSIWEIYSFAHLGASVSDFLYVCAAESPCED